VRDWIEELSDARYDLARSRSYIALDVDSFAQAFEIVDGFGEAVDGYKVGLELFHAAGDDAIRALIEQGKRVFLDVKLHDIPTTVGRALTVICRNQIEMVNVHASGGRAMLAAARAAVDNALYQPLLIGVTVLTSLQDTDLQAMRVGTPGEELVQSWSQLCKSEGLDGVVTSALDVANIRLTCGPGFLTVVPGTRPRGANRNDQKRSLTPGQAVAQGATRLVLGRPVTQAQNRFEALHAVWEDMLLHLNGGGTR